MSEDLKAKLKRVTKERDELQKQCCRLLDDIKPRLRLCEQLTMEGFTKKEWANIKRRFKRAKARKSKML
jgi:hypothetical protein